MSGPEVKRKFEADLNRVKDAILNDLQESKANC